MNIKTFNDYSIALISFNVGTATMSDSYGGVVVIIFYGVKWYSFLRKRRIKKALEFINEYKLVGVEIKLIFKEVE